MAQDIAPTIGQLGLRDAPSVGKLAPLSCYLRMVSSTPSGANRPGEIGEKFCPNHVRFWLSIPIKLMRTQMDAGSEGSVVTIRLPGTTFAKSPTDGKNWAKVEV
jgi:hypothetical protein